MLAIPANRAVKEPVRLELQFNRLHEPVAWESTHTAAHYVPRLDPFRKGRTRNTRTRTIAVTRWSWRLPCGPFLPTLKTRLAAMPHLLPAPLPLHPPGERTPAGRTRLRGQALLLAGHGDTRHSGKMFKERPL